MCLLFFGLVLYLIYNRSPPNRTEWWHHRPEASMCHLDTELRGHQGHIKQCLTGQGVCSAGGELLYVCFMNLVPLKKKKTKPFSPCLLGVSNELVRSRKALCHLSCLSYLTFSD